MTAKKPAKKAPAKAGALLAADAEAQTYRTRLEALFQQIDDANASESEIAPNQDQVLRRLEAVLSSVAEKMPTEAAELSELIIERTNAIWQHLDSVFEHVLEWAYLECELRNIEPKERALAGARARVAKDPAAQAMTQIREEWERRGRPGAKFAREMHLRYAEVIESEGSIKNAISRWRKA